MHWAEHNQLKSSDHAKGIQTQTTLSKLNITTGQKSSP